MNAYIISLPSGIVPIQIEDIQLDIYQKLKSATIVGQPLEKLSGWATHPHVWLGYEGSRYRIDLRKDGSFTATLGDEAVAV